jgi:hypothetical protein
VAEALLHAVDELLERDRAPAGGKRRRHRQLRHHERLGDEVRVRLDGRLVGRVAQEAVRIAGPDAAVREQIAAEKPAGDDVRGLAPVGGEEAPAERRHAVGHRPGVLRVGGVDETLVSEHLMGAGLDLGLGEHDGRDEDGERHDSSGDDA